MNTVRLEKWSLSVFFVVFFAMIFMGAWHFSMESFIFPVFLSATGLILLLLFVLEPTFMPIQTHTKQDTKIETSKQNHDAQNGVYAVFVYTGIFAGLAYLFGFYIASVASIVLYVYWVRKSFASIASALIILCIVILGLVYMFDTSFGHYYANGAVYTFHK